MAHTPGPWGWRPYFDDGFCFLASNLTTDKKGRWDCDAFVIEPHDHDGEASMSVKPEDAALIAAAPEMLDMLKRCRFVFEDIIIDEQSVEHGLWQGEMLPRLINDIEALIARAEGGTLTPDGCGESR
jgi:hypothetical protein